MKNVKNIEELKKKLTTKQYNICFLKGTEPPFSGKYTDNKKEGMYVCVVCGNKLFSSKTKFESGSGWPAFDNPETKDSLEYHDDNSLGMHRMEVSCKNCGSHLGHVFEDGPTKSGKRFCINSLALDFIPN